MALALICGEHIYITYGLTHLDLKSLIQEGNLSSSIDATQLSSDVRDDHWAN